MAPPPKAEAETKGLGKKLSDVLKEVGDLWNESQYSEEFDVSGFVKKLR
jgi:hypothetical protein